MWMPVQDVIPDFQAGFVVYGPTLLEKNQDAGHRFMLAYRKAVRQYNQGKTPRNLDILAKEFELDRGLLEASCWQPFRADGHINAQSVFDFQAWAVKEGYLDTPVGQERFWDSRFLDRANQAVAAAS
jgi:NitT/TauT family transport system substrate-binding protein